MSSKEIILSLIISLVGAGAVFAQGGAGTFVENKGQYPSTVKFYTNFKGGTIFIEKTGLTYAFQDPSTHKPIHSHLEKTNESEAVENYAIKVNFLETGSGQKVFGDKEKTTRYNFFYGNNRDRWISGAQAYSEIIIEELYPGIDLKLSSFNGRIKYDLILEPGKSPECIKMRYEGVDEIKLDGKGLCYDIPYGKLYEQIPASYALCDDQQREIRSSYVLEDNVVSFTTEEVDRSEKVIIDPLLVFSTYSGSPSDNWGNTATFDAQGNAYAGGITTNTRGQDLLGDFPATAGAYQTKSGGGWDVAISKFDSTGTKLLYATFLGGAGSDVPQSLIVDDNGDLLILGVTSSANFPTSFSGYDTTFNGGTDRDLLGGIKMIAGSDLFVTKLSADGSTLLGSTFIGGTLNDGMLRSSNSLARNYGDESRGDINFDSEGNIVVASRTESADFPVYKAFDDSFNGNTDAVIFKLSPNLNSLLWSTFYGGSSTDIALSIKVDSADNLFIAGGTSSSDFPVTDSAYLKTYGGNVDGWVAHLYTDGDSVIASTYLGTTSYDQTFFLDLDAEENVYLAGQTTAEYPVSPGKYSNGVGGQFIHKLTGDLQESVFSTVIGSSNSILPAISLTAFLVNECDNIYLSGWGSYLDTFDDGNNFISITSGLPVTADAHDPVSDGSSFYLAVLSGDASELLYATHLGNTESYVHVDGGTSRFDKNGIVYHSVCASCATDDSSFPTTPGAYSELNVSSGCSNAIFKFDLASLRARLRTNNVSLTDKGLNAGCLPLAVVFENFTTGGKVYEWDFGDGNTRTVLTKDTILHYYEDPGSFRVQLRAFDPNTCIAEDFAYTLINVAEPIFSLTEDLDICYGEETRLVATGGTSYQWFPEEGLDNPRIGSPIAQPTDTTTYTVQITNTNGCSFEGSVQVNVIPQIIPKLRIEQSNLCGGSREVRLINESENAESILWSLGDGTNILDWQSRHTYSEDGEYKVRATLLSNKCSLNVDLDIKILELNIPNVLTRNNDGINDVFKITSSAPVGLKIFTRWGTKVFEAEQYQNNWSGEGLTAALYFYEAQLENGEICGGWVQLLNDN